MDDIYNETLVGHMPGTLYNHPILEQGVHGNALKFDGVNQWVDLGTYSYVIYLISSRSSLIYAVIC